MRLFPRRSESNDNENATDEVAESVAACEYCLQARCITSSPFKPQGRSDARITNHTKRRKDYRWYWRTLKDCGLWENPIYLAHKLELGCLIDDAREVCLTVLSRMCVEGGQNPLMYHTRDTADLDHKIPNLIATPPIRTIYALNKLVLLFPLF